MKAVPVHAVWHTRLRISQCAKVAAALGVMLLAGCSASGPAFKRVSQLPEGKALVYIYRPDAIVGSAISYVVRANGKPVVDLEPGGYFPYLSDPGQTVFSARTEASDEVSETLRPGETYYLKGDIGIGFVVGHPQLSFVPKATGESEVAECVLLPAEQ